MAIGSAPKQHWEVYPLPGEWTGGIGMPMKLKMGLCKSKRVSRAFNEVDIAFDFEGQITCVLVCLVIVKISTFYMLLIIEILRYAHLFWIIDSTRSRYIYTTKGLSPDNKSSGNCPVHGYRYS